MPFGVKMPEEEMLLPLHVPPVGVNPVRVNGIGWLQRVVSGPALTGGRGFTVIVKGTEGPEQVIPLFVITGVMVIVAVTVVFPVLIA